VESASSSVPPLATKSTLYLLETLEDRIDLAVGAEAVVGIKTVEVLRVVALWRRGEREFVCSAAGQG
jgi:hypothetical protein